MPQFGGKNAKKTSSSSKRHFTVVMGGKEHGLYVSSTPSSAARKAVTKLCAANKSKKVEFHIREITQGSKKKTYGPYEGYIERLKEPIELKGRVIKYKPVAKLSGKIGAKKGGMRGGNYTNFRSRLLELLHNASIEYNTFKIGKSIEECKEWIKIKDNEIKSEMMKFELISGSNNSNNNITKLKKVKEAFKTKIIDKNIPLCFYEENFGYRWLEMINFELLRSTIVD